MNNSESRKELYTAHRSGYEKFIYFLMAASGACIGFALTQHKEPSGLEGRLLLCSLACWGGSFYFGLRSIDQLLQGLKGNLVSLSRGGQTPRTEANTDRLFHRADRAHRIQIFLLMLGVVIYVLMRFHEVIIELLP